MAAQFVAPSPANLGPLKPQVPAQIPPAAVTQALPVPYPDVAQSQPDATTNPANAAVPRGAMPPAPPQPAVPVPPPVAAPAAGPVQPTESARLAAQLGKLSAPPTTRESLLDAVAKFAPTLAAGAFGGLPAAAGAAQGVNTGLQEMQKEKDLQQQSLIQRVEAAQQHEQQNSQFGQTLTENKAKLAQEDTIANQLEAGRNARSNATITATDQRAKLLQDAENARQAALLKNNGPGARTPEGIAAAVSQAQMESTIPQRPQGTQQSVAGRDVPLPDAVAAQREEITRAGKTPPADQTAVQSVDDPNNPGHQMLVIVDKNKLTSTPVTGPATKTTASQSNATSKASADYDSAAKSYNALKSLAAQKTYIADQAMSDQYFNIIKPGSGARMNEANILRLLTPGPLADKLTVWAQKLSKGQPLDDNARNDMLAAAKAVLDSKAPSKGAAGKISVTAPDGSVHPFDTQAQADAFKKLAGIK